MAKVLLVEDDNNLREIYEARLQAEGYEIASAQDGEQALVVAKDVKPDLIISDVMMPKISGFEMLDILRNTDGLQNTRVIMLTALGQGEDKSRADSLGADRYLVKSQVTLEDIVKAAHQLLDEPETASVEPGTAAVPTESAAIPEIPAAQPAVSVTTEPPIAASVASAPEIETPATVSADPLVTQPEPAVPQPVMAQPATDPAAPVAIAVTTPDPSPAGQHHTTPTPREPIPVPAPTNNDEPADSPIQMPPSTDLPDAGTTASEQSIIDQQIEDFIHSSVESPDEAQPADADSPQNTADTEANDELMAEALQDLATPEAATEATQEPVAAAPQVAPVEPAATESTSDDIDIAGKKKLNPIPSDPKPDINDLLAQEEAREAAANPAPATPVVDGTPVDTEDQPKTPPTQPGDFDPTNITL